MQLLKKEQELLNGVIDLYYYCANQTQKYWQRDNNAALKIQSKYKMYVKRKQFLKKKAAAIKIQTQFRVFYAYKQYKIKQSKDCNQKNLMYFTQQAIIIQKWFRGYFDRKYKCNYYLRKYELAKLRQKNQQFRKQLQYYSAQQDIQAQQYKQDIAKMQFKALAQNLHHLSSTKKIPGVYNSPFINQKPSVFNKTVQNHLKQEFKLSYRWKAPNKQDIKKYKFQNIKKYG